MPPGSTMTEAYSKIATSAVQWKSLPSPGWRNWQTQRTQNPPTFGSWGFDSPSRHQSPTQHNQSLAGASSRHGMQLPGWKSHHYCAAQFSPLSGLLLFFLYSFLLDALLRFLQFQN